uniref:ORF-239; putative n=1 Tax=Phaseolus vulgaris TaxID=3885 RepID=Q37792_PHAVU|nr:sterility protein 2 [Phaseolus vulgaris]AAB01585.1 ORF-239; putative [Phaseolus vulgaris]
MFLPFNPQKIFGRLSSTLSRKIIVRISIVVVSVFTIGYLFCLVFGIDLSLIFGNQLVRSFRVLLSRLLGWEVPVLVFFVGLELDSSLHMQDPAGGQPAANPAAEQPSNVPSGGSTSKGTWWKKWIPCFTPQTEEGGHSVSPPEPTRNWVLDVDLPREDPSETIDTLRRKCAIIIQSFCQNNARDDLTFDDIAQRLVLETKGTTIGATREDFQRLLGELQNPAESDVYLRVLKALEKHPR